MHPFNERSQQTKLFYQTRDTVGDLGIEVDYEGHPRPIGSGYDNGAGESWFNLFLPLLLK